MSWHGCHRIRLRARSWHGLLGKCCIDDCIPCCYTSGWGISDGGEHLGDGGSVLAPECTGTGGASKEWCLAPVGWGRGRSGLCGTSCCGFGGRSGGDFLDIAALMRAPPVTLAAAEGVPAEAKMLHDARLDQFPRLAVHCVQVVAARGVWGTLTVIGRAGECAPRTANQRRQPMWGAMHRDLEANGFATCPHARWRVAQVRCAACEYARAPGMRSLELEHVLRWVGASARVLLWGWIGVPTGDCDGSGRVWRWH